MNLRQIEVFRAVMSSGSTTEAARLLHVSQPGISRMVRHLELQLGVALFERRGGRLVPTAEAKTLHAETEKVYRGVQHVRDVAAHLQYGTHSTLRVLSSANTALQLVPMAIAGVLRQYPASHFLQETLPSREITKLLVSEEADVAITSAPLDHPVLESDPIGHWTLMCAFPKDHPFLLHRNFSLKAALHTRLVSYSPEAPQSALIDSWLRSYGLSANVVVEVRSGLAACSAAAAGIGVAFVDDLSAKAHRADGLTFVELADAPTFPIYHVRNRFRPLSRLGEAFAAKSRSSLEKIHDQRVDVAPEKLI